MEKKKRIVIALGGNALGNTLPEQMKAVKITSRAIVDLIEKEDAGARSARNILNQFADSQYFYDMKVGGYNTMKIHKGMLNGEAPIFIRGGADSEKIIKYS